MEKLKKTLETEKFHIEWEGLDYQTQQPPDADLIDLAESTKFEGRNFEKFTSGPGAFYLKISLK